MRIKTGNKSSIAQPAAVIELLPVYLLNVKANQLFMNREYNSELRLSH